MTTIAAHGLGLRTRRGWIFSDVDLVAEPGQLVAITGTGASGRTSLLLALTGNARHTHGELAVHGRTALGYVPGVHAPEPGLTVREHVEERLLLLGQAPYGRRRRRDRALDLLHDYPGDPDTLGRDLDLYHTHLLCLTLATMSRPRTVAVDDIDVALSTAELDGYWQRLRALTTAEQPLTVLATCREVPAGQYADTVVHLEVHPR